MDLVEGRAYYLEGMERSMWDAPHPVFGAPSWIAAVYLGNIQGSRCWHLFEVWFEGKEEGVLLMNDADIAKLKITPIASIT